MKRRITSNISIIYPVVTTLCEISEKASLLSHARQRFGRYLAVEVLILTSIVLGIILLILLPTFPLWARIIAITIYAYRVFTMAFAHISILLLGSGKSTPGDRVHSRLRYLALTTLNFVEILLFGSLIILCLQDIGTEIKHYSGVFTSRSDILHYNFNLATGFGIGRVYPLTTVAHLHNIVITMLGIELIVVVLSILFIIQPEDEAITKERELPTQDYWEWRALSFEDVEWATHHELRMHIAKLLRGRNITLVADIGCGVGHLCLTLASEGYNVIGIDNTQGMLDIATRSKSPSIKYQLGDACSLNLPDKYVDAVIMRMLLHNISSDWRTAIVEAKRILKPQGILVVVEGFPPNDNCRSFFIDVLSKVHPRHFFTEEILEKAIESSGFNILTKESVTVKSVSVASWLTNAVPTVALRREILQLHLEMSDIQKQAYNWNKNEDDVFIDLKFSVFIAQVK